MEGSKDTKEAPRANPGPKKRVIRIKRRKLGRHRAVGLAHPDGLIEIDPRQTPREYLDTLIHELLHQVKPSSYWDESAVVKAANDLSHHLWEEGYRRMDS